MIIYCLNDNDFSDLKNYAKLLGKLINDYEWLINSYLIDFYINESWSRLPSKWQEYLNRLDAIQLSQWLSNVNQINHVQPLSLLCFQKVGKSISI